MNDQLAHQLKISRPPVPLKINKRWRGSSQQWSEFRYPLEGISAIFDTSEQRGFQVQVQDQGIGISTSSDKYTFSQYGDHTSW